MPVYCQLYYQSALHCQTHPLLTLSFGLLAHLGFDLKVALSRSRITDGLFPDYLAFGNALIDAQPALSLALWRRYQLDVTPLLNGIWSGKTQLGHEANPTTYLTFNALRTEAWMSHRAQHYSLGFFDRMVTQGQLMLWRGRIQMLRKLHRLGIL